MAGALIGCEVPVAIFVVVPRHEEVDVLNIHRHELEVGRLVGHAGSQVEKYVSWVRMRRKKVK